VLHHITFIGPTHVDYSKMSSSTNASGGRWRDSHV